MHYFWHSGCTCKASYLPFLIHLHLINYLVTQHMHMLEWFWLAVSQIFKYESQTTQGAHFNFYKVNVCWHLHFVSEFMKLYENLVQTLYHPYNLLRLRQHNTRQWIIVCDRADSNKGKIIFKIIIGSQILKNTEY